MKYSLQLQTSVDNKTQWAVIDMWQSNMTVATWDTHNAAYPLGLQNWTIVQDYILCEKPISNLFHTISNNCLDDMLNICPIQNIVKSIFITVHIISSSADSIIQMSLSACYDDEFTCNDGTCIELNQRCDLRAHCPDASDEVGCEKVLMPPEYISSLPPPGDNGGPLAVNISINIRAFSKVRNG